MTGILLGSIQGSSLDLRVADDGSVLVLSQGGGGTLQRVAYTVP